jgi:hypothetical protein
MTDVFVDSEEAEIIIESLRMGVPPSGHLQEFTVGRRDQLAQLAATIQDRDATDPAALLIQANYGAGKTHLLRLIREIALEEGFAVAFVTVDSRSGVRFNRMDQICSAVMREIEVPGIEGKGINTLFDYYFQVDEDSLLMRTQSRRSALSSDGKWSRCREIKSVPLWIALRGWHLSLDRQVRDIVQSWLSASWEYTSQRSYLYTALVDRLPPKIRSFQTASEMYRTGALTFSGSGHENSWLALEDLHTLAQLSGLRGLVLLFDEFEDVIQNLNRINLQRVAFTNLLTLMGNERFTGWKYFAVTPEFVSKCQDRLAEKFQYDFPEEDFDYLERIKMDPVRESDFLELAKRVREVHGIAYDWDSKNLFSDRDLRECVKKLYSRSSNDQVRLAMTGLVSALDDAQGDSLGS